MNPPQSFDLIARCLEVGELSVDVATLLRQYMHHWNESASSALLSCKVVSEGRLADLLARFFSCESCDVVDVSVVEGQVLAIFSYALARKHSLLPISMDDTTVKVYGADPSDEEGIATLESLFSRKCRMIVAPRTEIQMAISEAYAFQHIFEASTDGVTRG